MSYQRCKQAQVRCRSRKPEGSPRPRTLVIAGSSNALATLEDSWALLKDFTQKEFRGQAQHLTSTPAARERLRQALQVRLLTGALMLLLRVLSSVWGSCATCAISLHFLCGCSASPTHVNAPVPALTSRFEGA